MVLETKRSPVIILALYFSSSLAQEYPTLYVFSGQSFRTSIIIIIMFCSARSQVKKPLLEGPREDHVFLSTLFIF